MPREFELRELRSIKCPICGSRNKLHTELLDPRNREFVGYTFKCCSCGHVTEMLLDAKNNGKSHESYVSGRSMCIQPSFCPHTECPFHGYGWPDGSGYLPDKKEDACNRPDCNLCPAREYCPYINPKYIPTYHDTRPHDPAISVTIETDKKFL